jgi:hypothetical protein
VPGWVSLVEDQYMSRSSSWLAGDLDTTGGGSLETDLGESFLEGWIRYLLALLIGVFRRLFVWMTYRTIFYRALQFTS